MNSAPSNPPRTLYGVGVGPGDPELGTLRDQRILQEADGVLVPSTEASAGGMGRAEEIIRAACPHMTGRIQPVPFSMAQRRGLGTKRIESWRASADFAVDAFNDGAHSVALATVGDPAVYSTFTYLRANVEERLPDVVIALVPGITAMQAIAAAAGTPLVEGREILALVPATVGSEKLGEVLDVVDSVTVYKGGRKMPEVLEQIRERGRDAIIGTDVSLPTQHLLGLAQVEADESAPYFSTVLSVPERPVTGGKL